MSLAIMLRPTRACPAMKLSQALRNEGNRGVAVQYGGEAGAIGPLCASADIPAAQLGSL